MIAAHVHAELAARHAHAVVYLPEQHPRRAGRRGAHAQDAQLVVIRIDAIERRELVDIRSCPLDGGGAAHRHAGAHPAWEAALRVQVDPPSLGPPAQGQQRLLLRRPRTDRILDRFTSAGDEILVRVGAGADRGERSA
jgi:hypothetical protein